MIDDLPKVQMTHVERQLLARRRRGRRERPRGLLLLRGGVNLTENKRKKRVSEIRKGT